MKYLEVTEKGTLSFGREAREKLMERFPEDAVLQSAYKLLDTKTAIQQIDKLLIYADGNVLYPNYNLLGQLRQV